MRLEVVMKRLSGITKTKFSPVESKQVLQMNLMKGYMITFPVPGTLLPSSIKPRHLTAGTPIEDAYTKSEIKCVATSFGNMIER